MKGRSGTIDMCDASGSSTVSSIRRAYFNRTGGFRDNNFHFLTRVF